MVKTSYFDRDGMKKGAWSEDEDNELKGCIERLGGCVSNWRLLPVAAGKTSFSGQAAFGLKRCGKSCRLRWMNYLRPGLNRGKITKLEEDLIIELHNELGNKWSAIAANFPGRTDNDIKNYWHAHIQKRNAGGIARAATTHVPSQDEVVSEQGLSEESMEWKADADDKAAERVWHINLPPLFEEEELYGFGLWQNDIISDSSDAARFLQEDLVIDPVGEECFSMRLW